MLEQISEHENNRPQSLSDLEGGKRNPTIKTLKKIADALNISLADLMKSPEF